MIRVPIARTCAPAGIVPPAMRTLSHTVIHSMTGYAIATAELPKGSLQVELRSVNSRFLDVQFRIPDEFRALETPLRELVATRISRGKVDCRAQVNSQAGAQRADTMN